MSEEVIGKLFDGKGRMTMKVTRPVVNGSRVDADIKRHFVGLIRALQLKYPNASETFLIEQMQKMFDITATSSI